MKNFIQPGKNIDVDAPAAVSSGDGVMIGSMFGAAMNSVAIGVAVPIATEGVFSMPKLTADVMTVGQKVNWNNTNKEFQAATSDLDGAATVIEAADGTVSIVKVKLTEV